METLVKQTWHKIERTPRELEVKAPNDVSVPCLSNALGKKEAKDLWAM
jgi:hypothetical protein